MIGGIFSDLQAIEEDQKRMIKAPGEQIFPQSAQEPEQEPAHEREHESTQEPAQPHEHEVVLPDQLPTTDDVEELTFQTRRDPKIKVNTEVPERWKARLDDIAHQLKVGKYELVAYIIGQFLGEV